MRGLLVVQPTRVVPRKGIELAIELVGRLRDPDAVLLITSPAGDEGLDYLVELERRAEHAGVRLRYAADRFEPDLEGKPVGPAHTLHDAYLAADLITYPSLYEGYGNALIEAIFYGKPVVVNRYPVYVADIAPLGLEFIEIDGEVTDETAAAVRARAVGSGAPGAHRIAKLRNRAAAALLQGAATTAAAPARRGRGRRHRRVSGVSSLQGDLVSGGATNGEEAPVSSPEFSAPGDFRGSCGLEST